MDTTQSKEFTKEVILEMTQAYEKQLLIAKIQERFLQRMLLAKNSANFQQQLGQTQSDIKFKEEYLKFLEEIIKEYK